MVTPPNPHRSEVKIHDDNPAWEGWRRELVTVAAYEQLHDEPSRNYGISGVDLYFILVRPDGEAAIDWNLLTGHYLPHTNERLKQNRGIGGFNGPTGAQVTWHQRTPMYDGQDKWEGKEPCGLIGEPCYSDVGFSVGDDVYAAWAYGGLDGVWWKLRELLEAEGG